VLHLTDGRTIRIHHPDFIMASPSGRTVSVYQKDDTLNIDDVLLVTDIEFSASKRSHTKTSSNISVPHRCTV
jgi:hypothetical protein